jgi:hypothetical protein
VPAGILSQSKSEFYILCLWMLFQVHLQSLHFQFLLVVFGPYRLLGLWFYFTLHFCHFYQRFVLLSALFFPNASLIVRSEGQWPFDLYSHCRWTLMYSIFVYKDMDYSQLQKPSLWCVESTLENPLGWYPNAFLMQSTKDALWLCDENLMDFLQLGVPGSVAKSMHSFCTQKVARQPG